MNRPVLPVRPRKITVRLTGPQRRALIEVLTDLLARVKRGTLTLPVPATGTLPRPSTRVTR